MKREAILFGAVFVATFALVGFVLFHNRSESPPTQQQARTQPDLQETPTPGATVRKADKRVPREGLFFVQRMGSTSDNRLLPDLRGLNVAVFADGISCEQLSRSVLRANGVVESSLKSADVVLVVVRSSLSSPLNYSYDSLSALKRDSEMQLNISGPNAHIYVFSIDNGLRPSEVFHSKFKWDDYQFVR